MSTVHSRIQVAVYPLQFSVNVFPALMLLFCISGCGTARMLGLSGAESVSSQGVRSSGGSAGRVRDPWELWVPDQMQNGSLARDRALRKADEIYKKGDLRNAIKEYQILGRKKMEAAEREAVFIRIASVQLSLGEPDKAMATVSSFYGGDQRAVQKVHPFFGLILAYAYARTDNLQQSLAWFGQVGQQSGEYEGLEEAAVKGVRDVLRKSSDATLDSLDVVWSQNPLVGPVLGEERKLRARGAAPGNLVEVQVNPAAEAAESAAEVPQSGRAVGILLPLSGEHAKLGKAIRNGIELALTEALKNGNMMIVEKDTAAPENSSIEETVNSFSGSNSVEVILGPLLSNQAAVAAETARLRGIPLISFSKQASFQPGGGVFRFGPTTRSQILSLMESATGLAGLQRFALVYPASSVGQEFADEFRKVLREEGIQLLFDREYQPGDEQALMVLAEEVGKAEPDAIFCPDTINSAARFFTNISEPLRGRITPMGIAAWDDAKQLKQVARPLEGAIFPSIFFTQSSSPVVQQFIEAYRAKYGEGPDFLAAQGFDAAALVTAAEKNRSQDQTFMSAFQSINSYDGLTGKIAVQVSGEIERSYRIVVLNKGVESELSQNDSVLRELRRRKELFKGLSANPEAEPVYRAQ